MTTPIRIQRKRTKGFNLQAQSPDGRPVVSVCRPGKWGNPFKVGEYGSIHEARRGHAFATCSKNFNLQSSAVHIVTAQHAVNMFRALLTANYTSVEELRGKHLACFCALDAPCHADVLLELANA